MLIDNIIGVFSPRAKFKRLQYRKAADTVAVRKYEGAARTRRTAKWCTSSSSANAETSSSIEVLRNRARDLVRNDPWAARYRQLVASNVVGKGIMPNITGANDVQTDRINALWESWAETISMDYDACNNFYAMQALVMKSVVESGEVLIRRRRVGPAEGPIAIKLQVLESDHLATNRFFNNKETGNRVIQGIEVDDRDRPVAYHLHAEHPGNIGIESLGRTDPWKLIRIPADDIAHIYLKERPGQMRGVTWLAPFMILLRELDEFQDAMIVKQKVSACFSAFVFDMEAPADSTPNDDEDFDLEKLEPGIVEYLPAGKDIKFGTPPLPAAGTYEAFVDNVLHAIAAGGGVSYEALSGNLSQVNFSSARMGWLEMGRNLEAWRELMLNPQFNDKVLGWFLEAAHLAGENVDGIENYFTAPRREMIDPTKEVPAKIKAIRAGIETLSDVLRQNGKHPTKHFNEIKSDNNIFDQLQLILDSDPRKTNLQGTDQADDDGGI